jgi:hypothetical protein
MIKSALLAVSVVALGGALLFLPVSQQSAQAQMLGAALKASAADSGNLVTLVRRGGGGRGGHIARGGGGRAMHAYRGGGGRAHVSRPIRGGGRYAGNIGRYHGRYAGNVGRYHGGNRYYGNRYYGNRYYGYRRYGYLPWIGVGAGAYYYGSTNCDWLYRHNYRRWLAVCQ